MCDGGGRRRMACALRGSLLAASVACVRGANASTGSPSCPCVSAATVVAGNESLICIEDEACHSENDVGGRGALRICPSSGGCYDYPQDYGAEICAAHDAGLGPCGGVSDGYCGESWCFVDVTLCREGTTSYARSGYVPHAFYSYATCGGDSSFWDEEKMIAKVRGKTLRAAIPWLLRPYHYVVEDGEVVEGDVPNGTIQNLRGAYVDLFEEIAVRGAFEIEWTKVTDGAGNG